MALAVRLVVALCPTMAVTAPNKSDRDAAVALRHLLRFSPMAAKVPLTSAWTRGSSSPLLASVNPFAATNWLGIEDDGDPSLWRCNNDWNLSLIHI